MDRPTAPTVEIELDRLRHLKIDFNAIALAEKETGKNLLNNSVWKDLSAGDIRAFLWAALKWEDQGLTLEDVGAMIHPGNVDKIAKSIEKAWIAASPKGGGGTPVKKKG